MDMNLEQLANHCGVPASEIEYMRDMLYCESGFDPNDSTGALYIEDYLYEELLEIKHELEVFGES